MFICFRRISDFFGDCGLGNVLAQSMENSVVDKFIHDENLRFFRKRLAETTEEKQRQVLRDLIAEQEAKSCEWQTRGRVD